MAAKLPPLNAMKAFEAAARHGSFLGAAAELGVTAPAVSQQVKLLESHLGRQLFQRRNNAIALTDAGRAAFPAIAAGFESLASVGAMAAGAGLRSRLVVSALPSLALSWLAPRLGAFVAAHPGTVFELRSEEDPVEFARHDIDLRICYGSGHYPELQEAPLLRDQVRPLCAPGWLAARPGLEGPEGLADEDLIHVDWGPAFASHPTWRGWLAAAGVERRPQRNQGHLVGYSALAIDFATAGMGIALGQGLLAAERLVKGDLVSPFGPALALKERYYLVSPHARARRPQLLALTSWLADQLPAL